MNKGFLSKKVAGLILITSFMLALITKIIFSADFLILIGFLILTILIIFFLYKPEVGLIILLIVRTATDKIGSDFSFNLGQNFSINANALIGITSIGIVFLFLLFNKNKSTKNILVPLVGWIIYLAVASFSIIFSIDKLASGYELLRLLSIFFIFLLGYFIASSKKPEFAFKSVLYSSIIPLTFALYQLVTETGMGRIAGLSSRLYGTFSEPNGFAAFCLIIIAITVFYLIQRKSNALASNNFNAYLLLSFLVLILIATFSRGGWLALIIFSIALSLFKKPKFLLLIFAGLFFLIITVEPIRDRVEDVYNPPITSSVYWRFEQWDKMYRLFKQQPWTGYGAGTETIVHEKEFGFYSGNPYTHNDLLKNALEMGIFGVIAYSLLIISTSVFLLIKYFKEKNKNYRNIILIVFLLFLAELGFSMTSNILRSTVIQWLIWFLVGSSLGILIKPKKRT